MNLNRKQPPTEKQTTAFLALVEHRTVAAAARALDWNPEWTRTAVQGFVARSRNIAPTPTGADRAGEA